MNMMDTPSEISLAESQEANSSQAGMEVLEKTDEQASSPDKDSRNVGQAQLVELSTLENPEWVVPPHTFCDDPRLYTSASAPAHLKSPSFMIEDGETAGVSHGSQAGSIDVVQPMGIITSDQLQSDQEVPAARDQGSRSGRHGHRHRKPSRWFYSKRFRRYWNYHRKMWEWFKHHQAAEQKAAWQGAVQDWYQYLQSAGYDPWAAYMYMYYMPMMSQSAYPTGSVLRTMSNMSTTKSRKDPTLIGVHHNRDGSGRTSRTEANQLKRRRKRKRARARKARRKRMASGQESLDSAMSTDEESDNQLQMEITDDMLDFFEQSAKFRKERDAAKNKDSKNNKAEDKHVLLDGERKMGAPTAEAPSERPGVRRTSEMKSLYGRGAAMIHGMETAIQLNFDRNCDIRQPKHWPALPLEIKFN